MKIENGFFFLKDFFSFSYPILEGARAEKAKSIKKTADED